MAWIHDKKLYNIRHNVDLLESREGGVLAPKLPKFIIIYSWERPTEYEVYASIRVSEKKESTMKKMGYPDPQGAYFLYDLGKQYDLPSLDLAAFLIAYKQSHQDFVDAAPILVNGNDLKAYAGEDEKWFGLNDLLPKVPAQKKKSSHKPQESRESVIQKMLTSADVKEDYIERLGTGEEYESILELLLRDQSKGERTELIPQPGGKSYKHYHIIWATDDYKRRGEGYGLTDEILPRLITRKNNRIIRPRAVKSKEEQQRRIKQKAEVFTLRGSAMRRTISLMRLGSVVRMSSITRTTTTHGLLTTSPSSSPKKKAAHGVIISMNVGWRSVVVRLRIS